MIKIRENLYYFLVGNNLQNFSEFLNIFDQRALRDVQQIFNIKESDKASNTKLNVNYSKFLMLNEMWAKH